MFFSLGSAAPECALDEVGVHSLLQTLCSLMGIWGFLAVVLSNHRGFFLNSDLCLILFLEPPVARCL